MAQVQRHKGRSGREGAAGGCQVLEQKSEENIQERGFWPQWAG